MCSRHARRSFYANQDDINRVRSCNGRDFVRGVSRRNDCACANVVYVGTSLEEHGGLCHGYLRHFCPVWRLGKLTLSSAQRHRVSDSLLRNCEDVSRLEIAMEICACVCSGVG